MKKTKTQSAPISEMTRVRDAAASAKRTLDECLDPLLSEAAAYELIWLRARLSYLYGVARRARGE